MGKATIGGSVNSVGSVHSAAPTGPNGPANGKGDSLSALEKAYQEAKRQRKLQGPGVAVAETVLGMMPAPGLGATFKLGNMMGAASEDALKNEAISNPNADVHVDPDHPGGMFGRINGMMYSNRADVPGYNGTNGTRGLGQDNGTGDNGPQSMLDDEETRRKKLAQQQARPVASSPTTLLGSPVDLLGPVNAIS